MKRRFFYVTALLLLAIIGASCAQQGKIEKGAVTTGLRAPAYPLVTIDPYTSAWSTTDQLFEGPVKHWTGKEHPLIGAIRVDGQVYRFLGKENVPLKTVLPMAGEEAWEGRYTFEKPKNGWDKADFNDSSWTMGRGAFGTPEMPSLQTQWTTKDIWVRREFTISAVPEGEVYLTYSHDDIFELYLNGKQLVKTEYEWHNGVTLTLDKSLLKAGEKNVIAAHCHNRTGGGYVDFGLYTDPEQQEAFAQTAVQKAVALSAMSAVYSFTCGPVDLDLRFTSPLLPVDLDLLSRPVNYVSYEVFATDGGKHDVQLYFEGTPQWAVNEVSQEVELGKGQAGEVRYAKAGTTEQPVLQKKGDNVRIDWGYFYMAAPGEKQTVSISGDYFAPKNAFAQDGSAGAGEEKLVAKMNKAMPVLVVTDALGEVSDKPAAGYFMIGYDDLESIQYFGTNLKGWWTKNGTVTIGQALQDAAREYTDVMKRCVELDNQVWEEALAAGGKNYADLCVLAFRQSIAAHKLVKDTEGNTLFLSKENFSNGSIGTVDITYPSAPLYLKYNPELLKGMMNPIFYYSESGKWTKPFAAHDVGTYPLANGQTYGGDMPVEESGNMLILATAIAKVEGNAAYAEKHWEVLTIWANYLLEKGLDPENQLCTDDFAGHFAHNVNLSVKAIVGIAGYGKLAGMLGKNDVAEKYTAEAKRMAGEWMKMADDGDHYRLTFDQPGTWSQKYNMVWDKLLGLNVFPKEIAQKELAYYLTKQNAYGLPLDNRKTYTKSDWIVWTATLADDQETFQKIIDPLHRYVNETPTRVPMSDWYETTDAKQVGFQARSVVGGYFIKMLE
ncbi:MAG: glutaminase domain-containing protein [Mangrovibacterium sp.]